MKTSETSDIPTQDWAKLLAAWKHSSLSGVEFCKRKGLSYHQFVYWKKKLSKPASVPKQQKQTAFVKVKPLSATPGSEGLTITLPGGILIRGVNDSNIDLVRQLLEYR